MSSCITLLCALLLLLLGLSVEASSGGGGSTTHSYELSKPSLTQIYNSQVFKAEFMKRPLNGFSFTLGPLSHSGVRSAHTATWTEVVTLADGSQWLVHQGENHGVSSDTVTVADLVAAGGTDYSFFFDNCHMATQRMMTHGVSPFSCRSSISPTCRAASAPAAPAPSSRTTSCGTTSHSYDLSGSELRRIYNSPVFMAERLKRPLDGQSVRIGPISHSGVRKVADFVAGRRHDYSVFFDNCHLASEDDGTVIKR
ncbi:hypothetical protein F7725_017714 [Dissostichus mawsoni]|uniref:Uncharacterized protein n=1 Tax=Dissostichus mawsoni TaxID=36200 RepID=A0A7J5XR01_DISMA|nr:hypothetical protein F7725_017714 [Dissostichus mawsoni]